LKKVSGLRKCFREILSHPNHLRALAGKKQCCFLHTRDMKYESASSGKTYERPLARAHL